MTEKDYSNNEQGWDQYAEKWSSDFGESHSHLGDEWTAEVADSDYMQVLDEFIFKPYLRPVDTMVEIGPGGGRITEALLPFCNKKLIACDVSQKMLDLVTKRFEGQPKVECLKLSLGKGLAECPENSADAICSFETFVHIDPHDIYEYVLTFWKVMRPGAIGIIHHSNVESMKGWERFVGDHPYCINRRKPAGAFSVMTPGIMKTFLEQTGFELVAQIDTVHGKQQRDAVTVFKKPKA